MSSFTLTLLRSSKGQEPTTQSNVSKRTTADSSTQMLEIMNKRTNGKMQESEFVRGLGYENAIMNKKSKTLHNVAIKTQNNFKCSEILLDIGQTVF